MKFNIQKCSVMHCGKQDTMHQYTLYGIKLRIMDCEKDLGVLINSDMNFKDQAMVASKKANRVLGMIRRNFECINSDVSEILYGTLVRPNLEYAIQVWSPYQESSRNDIEKVQKRATKMLQGLKHKSYEERLR